MPLYDHFHGRIARRPWESLHGRWAYAIADDLNRRLPQRFVADAPMHLGSRVSADVAEVEHFDGPRLPNETSRNGSEGGAGGVATALETVVYSPPAAEQSMPADFPPEIMVEVKDVTQDYQVIAVVEIMSPANKKEASKRNQMVAKCLSCLGKGIGLVVIDVVTERRWNMHNGLVRVAEKDARYEMASDPTIYAVSYRPVSRNDQDLIDFWTWPLVVGDALPAVPLALKGYGCVKLELEATYTEACERSRIPG